MRRNLFQSGWLPVVGLVLMLAACRASAFALLGPYEPWMEATNGLKQKGYYSIVDNFQGYRMAPDAIGGPMEITNEYRWNVPVITYGFDPSFLSYFGSNGVAAINSAIQVFNDLPPISSLALTNYSLSTRQDNPLAQAKLTHDLKLRTLQAILEQMGLAQPSRNIFVLKKWVPGFSPATNNTFYSFREPDWGPWAIPDSIVERNYDPQTLQPSHFINGVLYTGFMVTSPAAQNVIVPFPTDPFLPWQSALAEGPVAPGQFANGLTHDDVGGLAYLLATNNVNFENLLPDVTAAGGNLVNGAWRPGVDKITFVLHPTNALSGAFVPSTNFYTDHFFTNGVLISQPVVRIVSQPDILFSVTDFDDYYSDLQVARTGTTNWLNLAELNGRPAGAGPGIIRPPILIAFNKAGIKYFRDGIYYGAYEDYHFQWASYDFSISSLEVYPQTLLATNQTNIRMQLAFGDWPYRLRQKFLWSAGGAVGTVYQFQTTTDLVNWAGLFSVTNDGSVCRFFDNVSDTSARAFYRLVPQ